MTAKEKALVDAALAVAYRLSVGIGISPLGTQGKALVAACNVLAEASGRTLPEFIESRTPGAAPPIYGHHHMRETTP